MKPIAVFFHCLFMREGQPPTFLPAAFTIIQEQMAQIAQSGLGGALSEFVVGMNGGLESMKFAEAIFPQNATIVMHGLQCHTENRTILELEKWVPAHPDWYVLYIHSKGATRPLGDVLRGNWRRCMMRNLVTHWRNCVADLDAGCDAVGCHFMNGDKTPPGQSIFAGNFFWAKASYLSTITPLNSRDRIKVSGLDSVESRYESEVWIGNGTQPMKVRDYHTGWIDTCQP